MKKRLGIVTTSNAVGLYYKEQLLDLFEDDVQINHYSFENNDFDDVRNLREIETSDLILISTYSQYEIIKNYLGRDFNMVIGKLTLSKDAYMTLKNLKDIHSAMFVNLSIEMAIETIGLLYALGINHIKFTPVYPNMEKIPDLDVAITTGESRYVPSIVNKVYDLGHRLIDEMTIIELIIALGLEYRLENENVINYFDKLVSYNMGTEYLLNKSNLLRNQLNTLLKLMDKGLIHVDKNGNIASFNGIVEQILKISGGDIIGKSAKERLPQIDFYNFNIKNKLIKINDEYITVSVYKINSPTGDYNGSYAIVEDFESKEKAQNKLRLQLMSKGHVAKYDINNIIGESDAIKEVKSLITRMAPSNSPVLITGESGTGKELVAQAIHNLSNNKDRHFIAINCAAFNPSLLESELFGYEPGAFTGAVKEGKKGIFEMANNGTLFLDEIGEMNIDLQVKLLRVIQEGEFMRVGGNEIIKVNLRIIAATNLDLLEQIKNGLFRKDLYYRLNVLPINIPPLRKRKEDIESLLNYFIKQNNSSFVLDRKTLEILKNYDWDGNIRELINCVLYLDNLNSHVINPVDLPHHIRNSLKHEERDIGKPLDYDDDKNIVVLKILYDAFLKKIKLGRRSISEIAFDNNYHISEYDVKGILEELDRLEFIHITRGRGGTTISKKGIEYIANIN
ncbi:MAG: sigma 54-interacting transcriptional regulator [Tissierellaceae bacterium]|nr:sigma 54-interacting transcriptional regulator [Tissierellaceae bacterium]